MPCGSLIQPFTAHLGHLDLKVVSSRQVQRIHTEPPGCDLLDRRARIHLGVQSPAQILTSLPRVAFRAHSGSDVKNELYYIVLFFPRVFKETYLFIARARVVWVSKEMDPKLIAPVQGKKRSMKD